MKVPVRTNLGAADDLHATVTLRREDWGHVLDALRDHQGRSGIERNQVYDRLVAGLDELLGLPVQELPAWDEMSDLDKGAALLHLHKREWEGEDYAESDYPARYIEHPLLVALLPEEACAHAVSLSEQADALEVDDYNRLYDLALDADRGRS